jgi:hypothetical protein
MSESLFQQWQPVFLQHVQDPSTAIPLKEAAVTGQLADWTACLTAAVVRSCEALRWRAAGKGHSLDLLPQVGQEYLGIDVMAFAAPVEGIRWPLPLTVFELENARADNRVAYSLWKVLCIRAALQVVFAYRPDWEQSRALVAMLEKDVIRGLTLEESSAITGQTVVVVGNRGEGETFPWGYFKYWMLNTNLGRFEIMR